MHADVHEQVLNEYLVVNGIGPQAHARPDRVRVRKGFGTNDIHRSKRRLNHLCDRLWLIAAIEHYTAVMGDFALNCAWDDHSADPTMIDLFRWHAARRLSTDGRA